jgi:hypothetical protein
LAIANPIARLPDHSITRFAAALSNPGRRVSVFRLHLRHIQRVAVGIGEVREAAGFALADLPAA